MMAVVVVVILVVRVATAGTIMVMVMMMLMPIVVWAVVIRLLLQMMVATVTARSSMLGGRLLLRTNSNDSSEFGIPRKGFVILQIHPTAVLDLPAGTTKISEAHAIAAEVWSVLYSAHRTKRILQIGIHLQFLGEFGGTNLDECGCDCLHVRARIVERYASRSERILVLVRVNAYIYDTLEQIVHDHRQTLGCQLPVECPDEHRFRRV